MKQQLPLILVLVSLSFYALSQTTGDYQSNAATFDWNTDASWQRWNGSAWVVPTAAQGYPGETATSIAGTVTIRAGHTVRANVDVTTNDIGNLIINGTLDMNTNNIDLDLSGDLTISGGGVLFMDDNDLTIDVAGNLTILGTGILNMNDDPQDIVVTGNLTMDATSQIQGDNSNCTLSVTGTFSVPATATNARIAGIRFTITGATTVAGTLLFNDNTGTKTFTGKVTVTGSWTSTAITSSGRLVFKSEIITSGVFACGCQ